MTALPELESRNRRTALIAGTVGAMMVGLAFASAPLYDLYCRVTGFGGTTQVADAAPEQPLAGRSMTIRFDASINRELPWDFDAPEKPVRLAIGETGLAFYKVTNNSNERLIGTATFNVSPPQAGYYFSKIDCFCFTRQVLEPGESAELPVTFFIDPEIIDDPELDGVNTVTLSYTFFKAHEAAQLAERKPRG
jgi:cytochrome c oxidase assembly protein subunit 11